MKSFKLTISTNNLLLGILVIVMYACAATCYVQSGDNNSVKTDKNISISADSTSINIDVLNGDKPIL